MKGIVGVFTLAFSEKAGKNNQKFNGKHVESKIAMRYLLLAILSLFLLHGLSGCSSSYERFEDSHFDAMMFRFLEVHLRYPKTGEDFCYSWFKVCRDSDDFLYFLKFENEGLNFDLTHVDLNHLSYQNFCILLDSLCLRRQQLISHFENIPDSHFVAEYLSEMSWLDIYQNRKWIWFEEKDSMLIMYDTKHKYEYVTPNLLLLDETYLNHRERMKFDMKTIRHITHLNILNSLKIYDKDSIPFNDWETEESEEAQEIQRIKEQEYKELKENGMLKDKKIRVLHYDRKGKMKDFLTGEYVPIQIVHNDTIISYLNKMMQKDLRISFIHFRAICNE